MSLEKMAGKFLGNLVGSSVGETADGIVNALNKAGVTPGARDEVVAHLDDIQAEIAKVYAGHRTLFVAGARPFIMWVCGAVIIETFILFPVWFAIDPERIREVINITLLNPIFWQAFKGIVALVLGLGIYRTYEKRMGVAK